MHYMSPTYGILELSFGEEHYMEKLTGLDQCSKVDSEQVIIEWIIKSERDGMNMSDAITLNYYNSNAAVFSETTKNVDFSEVQQIFTKHLSPDASILDFGCGSGRDTKYFLNNGYHVTATDGSDVLCKMANEYTGIQVKQMLFEELDDRNQYDGIWACASVLHLSREKLPNIFHKMHQALKTNGIIYTSFKYGTFEGERNGRYFTDFTEGMFEEFVRQISGLQIEKMWITGDVREGRGDERWLNILLRKTDVC